VDVPAGELRKPAFALLREKYANRAGAVDEFRDFCKRQIAIHRRPPPAVGDMGQPPGLFRQSEPRHEGIKQGSMFFLAIAKENLSHLRRANARMGLL
jgi:hypothetical protein